jgi:hypothetical protein
MNINDYLLTSLRDGQSAEDLAKDLSAALQVAEKQITEEKRLCEQSSQLKTDLCDCLRKYVGAAHPQTYDKLVDVHGKDFTNDEIIEIVDNTIKNTSLALKLYESIADFCGEAATTPKTCSEEATTTNWEKLFGDFFNKYNL